MGIVFQQLTENELGIFIQMRIDQLREEGAKEEIDLKPVLQSYYQKHMADNTLSAVICVAQQPRLEEPVNCKILPMTAAHLPQVAALEQICFPADPWSMELFRAALDNPRTAILLAEGTDGSILGYAVLSAILDEGNLDNIAVAPDCRRRGVADALLSALTGFGREHLSVLMLEVRASNAPAIALYQKHGFMAVGRRRNYYDAPKEDAILMTLEFGHGTAAVE